MSQCRPDVLHWLDRDDRAPCPTDAAQIMEIQCQIMDELFGPIHDDTDVSIEMVDEVQRHMYRLYRPRWLNIVHLN